MQINLEKMLVHANERLTIISPATERAEQVEVFRKFLKIETERLRIWHRFGLGGGEIAGGRSYLVDLIVCHACHLATSEASASGSELHDCAVIALGGYGRKELAPFS